MYDGILHTAQRIECPANDMLACLRQHLHRYIVWNEIILHEAAQEFILRFRCGRKTDLDFFEPHSYEEIEKRQLLIEAHWNDERLIAVAQIDRAPYRRLLRRIFAQPVQTDLGRHIVSLGIFRVVHDRSPVLQHCII